MKMFTVFCLLATLNAAASADDLPSMISELRSTHDAIRIKAADAIGKIGHGARDAGEALMDCAQDSTQMVRVHAIRALGEIGAIDALPMLSATADRKGEPDAIRGAARNAIARIKPLTPEQSEWLKHAREYVSVGQKVLKIPVVDFSFPNSRRITADQARRELRAQGPSIFGGTEAAARDYVVDLPHLRAGEYGVIGDGLCMAKVIQVLGPEQMLVESRGDRDGKPRPILILGYSTANLTDGDYWYGDLPPGKGKDVNSGAWVLIVGTDAYTDVLLSRRTAFVGIPVRLAIRGISYEQWKSLPSRYKSKS